MTASVTTTSAAGAVYTPAATSVDRPDQMGKDTFLKLLVAQMRYQDPSKPADTTAMMAQTATFSQVEKLEELAASNAALLTAQRAMSAGSMVGRTVSYTAEDGSTATGTISSVRIGAGTGTSDGAQSVAVIGGVAVPMGRITEVSLPAR